MNLFEPQLRIGEEISNDVLSNTFGCSIRGGMRRSHETNTLVLISNHVESVYDDRWEGEVLHYTGMGLTGDQSLDFAQNQTLANSSSSDLKIFLFEVYLTGVYTFQGRVEPAGEPYQETLPDETGNDRTVWIFPLRQVSDKNGVVSNRGISPLSRLEADLLDPDFPRCALHQQIHIPSRSGVLFGRIREVSDDGSELTVSLFRSGKVKKFKTEFVVRNARLSLQRDNSVLSALSTHINGDLNPANREKRCAVRAISNHSDPRRVFHTLD